MRLPIADIKRLAQARAPEIVRELLPRGRREGNLWVVDHPLKGTPQGKQPTFKIWLSGKAAGGFKDYRSGDTGDIIHLVALARGLDVGAALAWLRSWLGLSTLDRTRLGQVTAFAQAAAVDAEQGDAAARRRRIARAVDIFAEGGAILRSPAEAYLWGRRIHLRGLADRLEASLRCHPRLGWWRADKGARMPVYPAMVAAVVDRAGVQTAVHCTFLARTADLRWTKAPVTPAKLMLGHVKGSVIRVSTGASGLTPEDAAAAGVAGPLVITEGIEDALSIATAMPDLRVWAAGSLSHIGFVPVDHACVSAVFVAIDNDWGNDQARQALDRGLDRLEAAGRPVAVVRSIYGKDFNDLTMGLAGKDEEHDDEEDDDDAAW